MLNLLFVSCALLAHGVTDVDSPTPAPPEVAPPAAAPEARATVRWIDLDDDVTAQRLNIADAALAGEQLVVSSATRSGAGVRLNVTTHDLATGDRLATMASVTPADPDARFDYVGAPLAGNGRVIVAGAPNHGGSGDDTGLVYVFDQTTGALRHTLAPERAVKQIAYGGDFALHDDRLAIRALGPPRSPNRKAYFGSTECFDAATGARTAVVRDPMPSRRDNGDLSWADTDLAVGHTGAINDDGAYGAAWIIDTATGQVTGRYRGPARVEGFGSTVALSARYLVVGAVAGNARRTGHVFCIERASGVMREIAAPPEANSFGRHIAFLDEHHVVITANHSTRGGEPFAGNAWVFDVRTGQTVGPPLGDLTDPIARQGFGDRLMVTPTHVVIGMSFSRRADGVVRPTSPGAGTFLVIERAALLPPPE